MNVLKRRLPERIIRRITRHPVVMVNALSLTFRVGKDAWSLNKGEIDVPEFKRRTGSHVGSLGGGIAGMAAGAAAGTTIAPGIGTIVGGFAGGMLGEMAGSRVGREAVDRADAMFATRVAQDGAGPHTPADDTPPRHEPPKRSM